MKVNSIIELTEDVGNRKAGEKFCIMNINSFPDEGTVDAYNLADITVEIRGLQVEHFKVITE